MATPSTHEGPYESPSRIDFESLSLLCVGGNVCGCPLSLSRNLIFLGDISSIIDGSVCSY
jgi:hypothetical protein